MSRIEIMMLMDYKIEIKVKNPTLAVILSCQI